jgi:cell filamentation protein
MVYTAEADPLCYEGTSVLRNSAGIRDAAQLEEFELAMFLTRADSSSEKSSSAPSDKAQGALKS